MKLEEFSLCTEHIFTVLSNLGVFEKNYGLECGKFSDYQASFSFPFLNVILFFLVFLIPPSSPFSVSACCSSVVRPSFPSCLPCLFLSLSFPQDKTQGCLVLSFLPSLCCIFLLSVPPFFLKSYLYSVMSCLLCLLFFFASLSVSILAYFVFEGLHF